MVTRPSTASTQARARMTANRERGGMLQSTATRPPSDPRNGPVILRRDLLALGYPKNAITRVIRDMDLVRIRTGGYVPREVWEACDDAGRLGLRGRAVLRQARTPLILSHTSGLPEYDAPTWGFDLTTVHTTRTDGLSGRRAADVRQHEARVGPGDLVVRNGVPVMNPARVALECVLVGGAEAGLCVANYLVHEGFTTSQELNAQSVGMENRRDSLALEIVLRLVDGRVESVGETRTFWCCYQHQLPMPVPQYEVRDEHGHLVARLDFAWPERRLFLEFDGRVKYEKLLRPGQRASDVVIRERDRERLVCKLTGWRCIRITWSDLENPRRLAAMIREALAGH
jgi:hypothetical protein